MGGPGEDWATRTRRGDEAMPSHRRGAVTQPSSFESPGVISKGSTRAAKECQRNGTAKKSKRERKVKGMEPFCYFAWQRFSSSALRRFGVSAFPCFGASALPRRICSAPQRFSTRSFAPPCFSVSALPSFRASAIQRFGVSAPDMLRASTVLRALFRASVLQRFSVSALPCFSVSALPRFRVFALPRFRASALQDRSRREKMRNAKNKRMAMTVAA